MHEKQEFEPSPGVKAEELQQTSVEARATRNMSKRRVDEVTTKLLSDKDTDLFIVPPTSSSLQAYYSDELLSGDQLKAIESKVIARSKILAIEKLHEIEAHMNEVIFQQVTKLKQWSDFLKDFTETYDL
jgi:hypothetical protein